MSSSKAKQLKHVFADRWRYGVKRELLVLNILNILLPRGFVAILTGIGSGSNIYVEASYDNPLNAFDIVVFNEEYEPVAFIDVTGVRDARSYDKGKGLCVGSWKLYKSEKYGIQDRTWFIHVLDDRVSLRFINYNMMKKHGKLHRLHEGYGVEGQFHCCDSKYWVSPKEFIKWLMVKRK